MKGDFFFVNGQDIANWGEPEQAPHYRDCIVHVLACLLACLLASVFKYFTKTEPWIDSRSSYPDWRNGCNLSACMVIYIWWQLECLATMGFAYHAHGTADMRVVMNPAVTNSAWFVCHDKPQCIARSGSPHHDAWTILLVTYSVSNFPSASLGGDLFHFTLQDKDIQKDKCALLLHGLPNYCHSRSKERLYMKKGILLGCIVVTKETWSKLFLDPLVVWWANTSTNMHIILETV